MPKPPRPLAAPTFALALIIASAPLTFVAPEPATAAVVSAYTSASREPVAPGVALDVGRIVTTAGSQAVNVVEIEPNNPVITFESSLSNGRVTGLERTSNQAQNRSFEGHRVVAAINGDVWAGFSNEAEHAPNGLHVEAGELVTTGPAARPTFGVGADGRPLIGAPLVGVTLSTSAGTQFVINRVNQLRRPGEIVLYTPKFGSQTSGSASGIDVVISSVALPLRTTGTWTGTVAVTRPAEGGYSIAPGTIVLTAPATSLLGTLVPGESVTLTTSVSAGWESVQHAVGGREWIVRDGGAFISPRPASADEIHPRSAIGLAADGRLILATVDGRQPGWSSGVRLPELAELMIARGAMIALNLDGGGSTSLAVRRAGANGAVLINRPSDGSERSVTNSIQVISNAPTGPLATLKVEPGTRTVYRNATLDFRVSGMDAAYNPVPLGAGQVAWSVSPPIGTIDAAGHFVATEAGTAQVTASANGVAGTAAMTVLVDTTAPVTSPTRVTLPTGRAIGSTVPVSIGWNAATDEGSGVVSYELQRSVDGGAWATMPKATPLSRSTILSLPRNRTYQFQVRAVDAAGNVGAWRTTGSFRLAVAPETTRALSFVKGTWSRTTSASYDGGGARSTRTVGGIARFTFTGSSFAWVSARSPVRGAAGVYINGVFAGNVDTYSASTVARVMVFSKTWTTSAKRTVEIRTVGTPGHPRVDLDSFVVLTAVAGVTPPSSPPPAPTPTPPPAATPTPTPGPTPTPPVAPVSGDVLVGAGDIASCGLIGDTATAKLVSGIAGTVFTAGDNAYETGSTANFRDCYAPTWGAFADRTFPTAGNHEYETTGAAGYFNYFGGRAGAAGKGWYAYDMGSWRIYALNSNCFVVGCDVGGEQEQWLRADLGANPRECVLAYWHHPRFSSGQHGNDAEVAAIWNALSEAGAEVVVNGHDHNYERFRPQTPSAVADEARGIRQFVVGTGGASLRSFGTVKANSEIRNSSTHGVLKLTLGLSSYTWQFIPVAGKTFTDSGSGTCH
jgi:hypothetical protein